MPRRTSEKRRVRYAVVGQGYFAQQKILPAFAHARKSSELVALFSDDPVKLERLGRKYEVEHRLGYDQYDDFLRSGAVDAVYIALPNSMHAEYTVRAAAAGVHVLCEKPMATTSDECERMIRACDDASVRLMIGYRLHFEPANMSAVELVRKGRIGEPRFFQSSFSYQAKEENIRTAGDLGGGPLYDLGIYCINAARCLLGDEPEEVIAATGRADDPRFEEVDEAVCSTLRFPGDRLASFTCSFGSAPTGWYHVVGTKGDLCLDPAFDYDVPLEWDLTVGNAQPRHKRFRLTDQVAPELLHFSRCVLERRDPEPGGKEGLADVRVIEAIYESARSGRAVKIQAVPPESRPSPEQVIEKPAPEAPELVHADEPFQD